MLKKTLLITLLLVFPALSEGKKKKSLVGKVTKTKLSNASIAEITNENFPDIIDSFDYPNADIKEVVTAISELTGKNFIIDPKLSGKITILAPSPITVAEAYRAFLTALAQLGYTIVPSGKFLKIVRSKTAISDNIETYSGAYFPNSDQMITRIVKLKYLKAQTIASSLKEFFNSSDAGNITPYDPSNSLIISGYGSRIERFMDIINELDVPGFEEKMVVLNIKFASAKQIADLIEKIINKDDNKSGSRSRFSSFSRRSRRSSRNAEESSESLSLVLPDERTNSIIVVGNKSGIEKVKNLVKQLDFELNPNEVGGIYVYYVKHADAENIAKTISGLISNQKKSDSRRAPRRSRFDDREPDKKSSILLSSDVNIQSDKDTNSLIISGSKQDYEILLSTIVKLDIPRDQVSVKVYIMEMSTANSFGWGLNYYKFADQGNGTGRIGLRTTENISQLLNPAGDLGAILGFGSGDIVNLQIGDQSFSVPSLVGLINLFKKKSLGSVLSQPTLTAMDNKEAIIEVGEEVPAGRTLQTTGQTSTASVQFKDASLKLKITPYINQKNNKVKMDIDQELKEVSTRQISASELQDTSVPFTTRKLKTTIVVRNNDTAILGGLLSEKDSETVSKVPILGDIPIVGWLFKGKVTSKDKKNLLLFIRPTIIKNEKDTRKVLAKEVDTRIDFIKKNMGGKDIYGKYIDDLLKPAQPLSILKDELSEEDDLLFDNTDTDKGLEASPKNPTLDDVLEDEDQQLIDGLEDEL